MNYRTAIAILARSDNTTLRQIIAEEYGGEERRKQYRRQEEDADRRISPRDTPDRRTSPGGIEDIKEKHKSLMARPTIKTNMADNDVIFVMKPKGNDVLYNKELQPLGYFAPNKETQIMDQIEKLREMKKIDPKGKIWMALINPVYKGELEDAQITDYTARYNMYIAAKKMAGR